MRRITDGEGVDVVIDATGPTNFRKDYRLLRQGGRLVMYGLSEASAGTGRDLRKLLGSLARMPFATMPWWKSLQLMSENKGVFGLNMLAWWDREGDVDADHRPAQSRRSRPARSRSSPVVAEAFPSTAPGTPTASSPSGGTSARSCSFPEEEPLLTAFTGVMARRMKLATQENTWRALAALAAVAAIAPAAASARPGVTASVWTIHGRGATSRGVDERAHAERLAAASTTGSASSPAPSGRLVLTAPEGLGDPDGSGSACALDNAKSGESTATEVSCAAGYIGAIVGDLGRGSDTFDADPSLAGDDRRRDRRPGAAARGRARAVTGWWVERCRDLLDGGGGVDSMAGGGGQDLLIGGPGADNLSGGGGNDCLVGGGGPDKLSGGGGQGRLPRRGRDSTPPRAARPLAGFRSA